MSSTLRDLERKVWARLPEGPGLIEKQQFAGKLGDLANTHGSDVLTDFADRLRRAMETFAFSENEPTLTAFPPLVAAHQLSNHEPCPEI